MKVVIGMPELKNKKHERLCLEYVIDYNATQAGIRSGYSQKTAHSIACELLKKPELRERVRELQAEQRERLVLSSDYVAIKLVECVQKSMQASPVIAFNPLTNKYEQNGEYQYDSKGATKALELLGKHLGMFTEKVELRGGVQIDDARTRLIEKLSEKGDA